MSGTAETTITLSMLAIVASGLVFAVTLVVANEKVFAANLCGSGFCEPGGGISYPSPLSHFFGGDRHGHHWHGYFGSYSHGSHHHR